MSQTCDHFGHLKARQLPTFTGLCALRDLDFNFLARAQIFGGDAKAAAGNLFDHAVGVVAIFIRLETLAVLAAFTRDGLCADPVHGNGERFMRLWRQRAKGHSGRNKAFADFGDRLNLVNRDGFFGEVEFQQIAQVNRRQFFHALRKLRVGRIAVIRDRALQQMHEASRISMFFAAVALLVKSADGQARNGGIKRVIMTVARVDI